MKHIFIKISSDSELITYEAIALAFTLATFDHQVSLLFFGDSHIVLNNPKSRAYGMVQSFELYDIVNVWHDFADGVLPSDIVNYFNKMPNELGKFDAVFDF